LHSISLFRKEKRRKGEKENKIKEGGGDGEKKEKGGEGGKKEKERKQATPFGCT